MKIIVNKKQLEGTPEQFIRRAGYGQIFDRKTNQYSYTRRFSRDFYPRFHLYIEESGETIIFNLHLDQKRPGYAGANRHNAEYDGEVVEREGERLKNLLPPDFLSI